MPPLTWNPDAQGRPTCWEGGIIRYTAAGKAAFVIARMVKGRRSKTLDARAHDLCGAEASR